MGNPSYTISIPVYKRVPGFREALASALSVEGCTEVLIVDDNSGHSQFEEICSSFNDNRIRYISNSENVGVFGNWNRCIALAGGEYMSILCSDDLIDTNAYKLFLPSYELDNKIDVFFGSFAVFKESLMDVKINRVFKKGKMSGVDLLANALNTEPGFPVMSIMRTETMKKYPFVAKPHSGNDFLWIYSHATLLNLFATDKPINYWRRHTDQDAIKSQSVTKDCWPLMYTNMAAQLRGKNDRLANKANRRANELVLSMLINGFVENLEFQKKILESKREENMFLGKMLDIIHKDRLLSALLNNPSPNPVVYNIARFFRKIGYYPF